MRDVAAMRQFALITRDKHAPAAAAMASEATEHARAAGVPVAGLLPALTSSLKLGLAYGNLGRREGRTKDTMPREVWEALCFSAGLDTPTEPPELVPALQWGCFAAQYCARVDDTAWSDLLHALDWNEIVRHSQMSAAVHDVVTAGWEALRGDVITTSI